MHYALNVQEDNNFHSNKIAYNTEKCTGSFYVKKKMDTHKYYMIVCSFSVITKSVNENKYNFPYYSYKE